MTLKYLMMIRILIRKEYRVNYDNDVMVQNVMTSSVWRQSSFCSLSFSSSEDSNTYNNNINYKYAEEKGRKDDKRKILMGLCIKKIVWYT